MNLILKCPRLSMAILAITVVFASALPNLNALAQTMPPTSTVVALPEATIKSLQEALTKQGIAVKADGVLNDETRAAIRKYQSVHHLPVTGEPDKATLDKLGVVIAPGAAGPPGPPSQGQMPGGMMMNCPMMQGQMAEMMKMMQGMVKMMLMMQGQMQPGQVPPNQMQPGAR